ncbi:MAG: hypothetical protein K8R74_11525 [Bacteroidales bacterium]|nr:hypothetical protein [Bacteroidales bacterium]
MKLEKILGNLNSLEKNSFIKIIDNIIANSPRNSRVIDKILADTDKSGLKNLDNVIISKIFNLVETEFSQLIKAEFVNTSSQLDILSDIITRDGNCIMKQDWFARLYENELKNITKKIKDLQKELENPKSDLSENRKRDYKIYQSCVHTAFHNDIENNREAKITDDELSILLTLSHELELSQKEIKLINYLILHVKKAEIDTVITELKNLGVIFYSKKTSTIFVADEMVHVIRKIREKEIADKFFRRILRLFREPQINLIARKHNIDRKLTLDQKIKEIINEGISFSGVLITDVHKEGINVSDKKKFLNELWSKSLNLSPALKGTTLDDKLENIIAHFDAIEKDEKVGISIDGYEKLLIELGETLPKLNNQVKAEFELQDENVLKSNILLDYNIKPRDILDIIQSKDLEKFCKEREIKTRGNDIDNILDTYKDSENLYLENYVNIGFRDLNTLKENGITVKEANLGIKFEDLTKLIFTQLGFNVDEKLKKELNTKKDKIDILLNLGNKELILIECKTIKESGYNKFSSVSRQMKSYTGLAKATDYKIIKSLLIAPDFSDDFINATESEYALNISLLTASSLITILEGFKNSKKHKQFPYKLLMRDVLIKEDRIIKAMGK